MNPFDRSILLFLNSFAQKSWFCDRSLAFVSSSNLTKGAVLIGVLWALWFRRADDESLERNRGTIIATFAGSFLALFLARLLALVLPFRERPLRVESLNFSLPHGSSVENLTGWSSFPSDHAALFLGLAAGVFLVARRLGVLALIYATVAILAPRVYFGLHYPTDILAGGLLGAACVLVANGEAIRKPLTGVLFRFFRRYEPAFYFLFFLLSFETANLFEDVRRLGKFLFKVAL